MAFVPLHVHSEYSLLDGAIRIPELVARARGLGYAALALTDHGNLYGAIEFYHACLKEGVKPIIGCEMYVAPGSRLEKKSAHGLTDAAYHLILLAQNEEGYRNLIQLSSIAFLQGFYYRPRIDKEVLAKHAGGLVCLSGCLHGEIAMLCRKNELPVARQAVAEYQGIFGKERFYLEVQDHGLPIQAEINPLLLQLSQESGAPLAATNDSHYLKREDAEAHDVLLCIQTASHVEEAKRLRFEGSEFYFKSEEEMRRRFAWAPQAVDNTLKVAEQCNLVLPQPKLMLPSFEVPKPSPSPEAYLEELCRQALPKLYRQTGPELEARLSKELDVIAKAGFASYFLIVWDFVRYAKQQRIPVGPGRGSAAGSLVAYLLGITGLDPLQHGLLFERFLNPERLSPPDIDIDFADNRREEIIQYVANKYGSENVAHIITFGTLGARAAIRDVGRALNYSYGEVDAVARLVPEGPGVDLEKALEQSAELARRSREEPRIQRLMSIARRLEGLARHASIHAAGLVISPKPLIELVPLCLAKNGESGSKGAGQPSSPLLSTQYSMESLEKVGLVKIDFLGLRTLSVIAECLDLIERQSGQRLDLQTIPLNDPATFAMLGEGDSFGIFQLESAGMRDLIRRFKPESVSDLTALNALFRPGPMGTIDEFLQRKQGRAASKPLLPQLEPILKETYGVIVYQEQVMQIAVAVGGFSLAQADLLRRAMSKKNREVLEAQRAQFLKGAAAQKIPADKADQVYDLLVKFGEYGFNKSHSAAYALLAYQTAYLKAHYPASFLCALLSSEMGNQDKVAAGLANCRKWGLPIYPPDVQKSGARFSLEGGGIRMGLLVIKNVGEGMVQSLLQARQEGGPFKDLEDLLSRVDTRQFNLKAVESFIKAGAFDCLASAKGGRAGLMAHAPLMFERAAQLRAEREQGQFSLFGGGGMAALQPETEGVPEWSENQKLAHEKEVLGFYASGHPLAEHEKDLKAFCTCSLPQLADLREGEACVVGGMIVGVKHQLTKRQERMARVVLEDLEGMTEVLVWPSVLNRCEAELKKDRLVLVAGKVDLSGEAAKVSAEEIYELAEGAQRLAKALHLRLGLATPQQLEELKTVLRLHPGKLKVLMHLPLGHQEVVQKLGPTFQVEYRPALLADLERVGVKEYWVSK